MERYVRLVVDIARWAFWAVLSASLSCAPKGRDFTGVGSAGDGGSDASAAGGDGPDGSAADGSGTDSGAGSAGQQTMGGTGDEPQPSDAGAPSIGGASDQPIDPEMPVCGTADDRACTVQCPCPNAEGVCTDSNQCVSGTSCVPDSGKKVGRSGDTCLATHCGNDKQDGGETSVDCGGECGCRASYEVVTYKNIPEGATAPTIQAASRDGKRLAGYINRFMDAFPALVAEDGSVTELEHYQRGGMVDVANGDGSVLVGTMPCANPPTCTETKNSIIQWSGSSAPKLVVSIGTATAMSTSGSVIVGHFFDSGVSSSQGFILDGSSRTVIPELNSVKGVTPDGKYVLGTLASGVQAGLWYAPTKTLTKLGKLTWTATSVAAVNGTDPVVVGYGVVGPSSYNGFRWKGGVLTELPIPPGSTHTLPAAVSANGTVVGDAGTDDFSEAFIWTDTSQLRTVVDELKARGLEPPIDLRLYWTRFISDDGKTVIGRDPGGGFWRVVLD